MELDSEKARQIVQQYIGTAEPLSRLGWGITGYVFSPTTFPSAIKVHRSFDSYATEVRAYDALRRLRLTTLLGLTIPKVQNTSDDLRIMDLVTPPFLLDFAGVRFSPPDFPPDTIAEWHKDIEFRFGRNAWMAHSVYHALAKHGLYYIDFRPSNMNLKGHPDALPDDPTDDNDESY